MRKWNGYEKGINLGGWFSQCEHTRDHYENFITEEDFAEIAGWGIDHVRIPVDYNLVEQDNGEIIEAGMAYIQRAVDWCEKYGLNMVLDLHKTCGFSFDAGENESGFFTSASLQERFYCLWEALASRFGKYHDRLAFELLNEVTDKCYCEAWNTIAETCIRRIRNIAPNSFILIGGYDNNCIAAIPDLKLPYDDKIVYNFHCYEPLIFTHQGAYWVKNMPQDFRLKYPGTVEEYAEKIKALALETVDLVSCADTPTVGSEFFDTLFSKAAAIAEERNVPLYCGEYGVIQLADRESTIAWYQAIHQSFEKYGIARAAWCYKSLDFGLLKGNLTDALIQYL